MGISRYWLIPPLPEGLDGLAEMGLDLRWSWSHSTDALWKRIDPELWELTRNPWIILQTASFAHLKTLAEDAAFRKLLEKLWAGYRKDLGRTCWFGEAHPESALTVAYFSMEFGLSEALPIYSGGLGILAGDYLKTASDMGVPVVAVGLLYQQGYFRQVIDPDGEQREFHSYSNPSQLPILPVRDAEGEWLRVELDLPGRRLRLLVWEVKVGRIKLYLLDSNDPANSPADQCITAELYGGGPEMRLKQEIVLGIGGWRLLRMLGMQPQVCHLNEGHAALAVLERARGFMEDTGRSFEAALAATRAGNIFTTHTPVEAGFDRFAPGLLGPYLAAYAEQLGIGLEDLLALGRQNPADPAEPVNMAYLAVRGSGMVNGVSRLHGEVSRRIFQPLFPRWPQSEVPVGHITNGVHAPSWDSAPADALWSRTCGKRRWLGTMEGVECQFQGVTDEVLWAFRRNGRQNLIEYARQRLARQLRANGVSTEDLGQAEKALDPDVLTLGFARRFTEYKRPNLLLHEPERLARLLADVDRPVQLIIAGKAHPRDGRGKALIAAWTDFIRRAEVHGRAVFLADYDMSLAEHLVQGVDVWINTPRRPWEASGTSGMKVLVNGGLNLSELDGWWAEAYRPDVGWAIGDRLEHDADPEWDARDAEQLYRTLEDDVRMLFYDRDGNGIPRTWVERMRRSMAELTPRFSTNRMLREYVESMYVPAAERYRRRTENGCAAAERIVGRQHALKQQWARVRFGRLQVERAQETYLFKVWVHLGGLGPEYVDVQLYAEPKRGNGPEIHRMVRDPDAADRADDVFYTVRVPTGRPLEHYTPRIVCAGEEAVVPLEANDILWYR